MGPQVTVKADVAAGEYLADQLMVPLAVAGGGSFTTLPLSQHAAANMEVIRRFLDVLIETSVIEGRSLKVVIRR
jgi:RNA 3'-terminal phosphate cyclase (ATP)